MDRRDFCLSCVGLLAGPAAAAGLAGAGKPRRYAFRRISSGHRRRRSRRLRPRTATTFTRTMTCALSAPAGDTWRRRDCRTRTASRCWAIPRKSA